jgi:hypothetical protein
MQLRNTHIILPRNILPLNIHVILPRNSHVILPRNILPRNNVTFSGCRTLRRDSIPFLSLSSCEAAWSRLLRISLVEPCDGLEFVNVFCWLPVGLIEAGPLDKVLESSSMYPRIKNGVHEPFLFAIDFHWWWWWLPLSG